ncbi:MAG TPA: proline dehydrogenase [Planctomycetaceae bacterium]|nr:proline dehydrogenase [Planctomycetaceae bacterium]
MVAEWSERSGDNAPQPKISIGSDAIVGSGQLVESIDPSRPGIVAARFHTASPAEITQATECAANDPSGWREIPARERYETLRRVAQEIRLARADLVGAAMADAGKTILESDPEISEAIDFVEFYASTALELQTSSAFEAQPRGAVIVISPWNFPIAIPCGGIAAALAAGNTTILKPASDTFLPAAILCECFWRAGVPREALQLVACSGRDASAYLLGHPNIKTVILTGGTETALRILEARPSLDLLAETGGKNATIISSLSDRDLAIKNVLHSAFSHAGQKCSATSLLLLEEEVYHDNDFRNALIDAASSLTVGSAWNLKTKMGPLIRPPSGDLARGIKELEPGESWALMPRDLDDNPCLFSPGIKWDVQRGSFTHLTELFGPVLGVMPYRDLSEAIDIIHETGFGLTSGLESLDDREQDEWQRRVQAGNLYQNRPTTGAIVLRQPFGGMGKSAFGPGIKAGGPNYVVPLMHFGGSDAAAEEIEAPDKTGSKLNDAPELPALSSFWQHLMRRDSPPAEEVRSNMPASDFARLKRAVLSYDHFANAEIRQQHDTVQLVGQDNFRRYLPMTHVRIRVAQQDTWFEIFARAAAVIAAGGRASISRNPDLHSAPIAALERLTQQWAADLEFIEETEEELAEAIRSGQVDRVRYAGHIEVPECIRTAARDQFVYIATDPVTPHGRIELLWYVREQSLCIDYHRYGNLGFRADEARRDVL